TCRGTRRHGAYSGWNRDGGKDDPCEGLLQEDIGGGGTSGSNKQIQFDLKPYHLAGTEDAPSEEWGGRGRPRHAERALGDLNRCTVRDENPNGHQDGLHLRHSVDCARGGAVRCLRDLENQISYGDVDGTN